MIMIKLEMYKLSSHSLIFLSRQRRGYKRNVGQRVSKFLSSQGKKSKRKESSSDSSSDDSDSSGSNSSDSNLDLKKAWEDIKSKWEKKIKTKKRKDDSDSD